MSGFTLDVKGFDEVLKKLDVKKFEQDITDELTAFGADVSRDAKQLVPVDLGFLKNAIDFEAEKLAVKVVAHKDYAAYVEFGTGPFAAAYVPTLPPEFQAYAMTFFVNGKGHVRAQPYLYPAFEKNRPLLLEHLRNLFK